MLAAVQADVPVMGKGELSIPFILADVLREGLWLAVGLDSKRGVPDDDQLKKASKKLRKAQSDLHDALEECELLKERLAVMDEQGHELVKGRKQDKARVQELKMKMKECKRDRKVLEEKIYSLEYSLEEKVDEALQLDLEVRSIDKHYDSALKAIDLHTKQTDTAMDQLSRANEKLWEMGDDLLECQDLQEKTNESLEIVRRSLERSEVKCKVLVNRILELESGSGGMKGNPQE